jgi:hypothetical protein
MNLHPEYQDFLEKIARHLAPLGQSRKEEQLELLRQKLITYIQTHPQQKPLEVKRALGGIDGVVQHIFFNLNHPVTVTHHPLSAKVVILSLLFFFSLTAGYLWWKFTPLLRVEKDRVQVLGGLIDIDGQLGSVKFGDNYEFGDSQFEDIFEGSFDTNETDYEDIDIRFDRGQMDLNFHDLPKISWNCKVSTEPEANFIRKEKDQLLIDFSDIGGMDCTLILPSKFQFTVEGNDGLVTLNDPGNDIFVKLQNGQVLLAVKDLNRYNFDLSLSQGLIAPQLKKAKSTLGEQAIEVKVELENGMIQTK